MARATGAGGARRAEAEDLELLAAVAHKDRAAFEALYRRYGPRVGGYLWKILRNRELVDEAVDDVMLVVWQKADRFDGRSRVSTWILGIAHNKALKTLERSRRERAQPTDDVAELSDREQTRREERPEADDTFAQRAAVRALGRELGALSVEHRSVIELAFFEGRSYAEAAEILGCPVGTVKTRIFHARRQLLRNLAEHFEP